MVQTQRNPLTERQRTILAFLEEWFDDHSMPPSVRDVQSGCDISSTSVVDYNLKVLRKRGYIGKQDGISRSVTLLGADRSPATKSTAVPIVGAVHPDKPFSIPSTRGRKKDFPYISVPRSYIDAPTASGAFAVKVGSPSFADALLREGDTLILTARRKIGNGMATLLEVRERGTGEFERMSIGRVYSADGMFIDLKPISPICDTTRYHMPELIVRGVVLGMIRVEDSETPRRSLMRMGS